MTYLKKITITNVRQIIDKYLSIQNVLIVALIGLFVYSVGFATTSQYERIKSLVETLAWPIIVVFSVMFFRKIFTYLFFSMDQFNFFGVKGTLNDVETVINERVQQLRDQDKLEEDRKNEIAEMEKKIKTKDQSKEEAIELAKEVIGMFKVQSNELVRLKEEKQKADRDSYSIYAMSERAKNNMSQNIQ